VIARPCTTMGVCASNPVVTYDPRLVNIAHFKTERQVGEGSFGKVHAVTWRLDCSETKETKWFAMKTMGKKKMLKGKAVKACERELELLKNLNHPFLSNLHVVFQSPKKVYFVLDLYFGGDLDFFVRRTSKTIPAETKSKLFQLYAMEMIIAINYIHTQHIVHRDIKPANVVISSEGHIGLIDFNVAKKLDSNVQNLALSFKGGHTGTPRYMAPEMLKQVEKVGHLVDYWAVGLTLFELYTGKSFLTKNKFDALMAECDSYADSAKIRNRIPKKFTETELDKHAIDFICSLLSVDPSKRISYDECIKHPYLADLNPDEVIKLNVSVPWKPDASKPNFDASHDADQLLLGDDEEDFGKISDEEQATFSNLNYNIHRLDNGEVTDQPLVGT